MKKGNNRKKHGPMQVPESKGASGGDALPKMDRGRTRNAEMEGEGTRADPGTVKRGAWVDASTEERGAVAMHLQKWAEAELGMVK